MLVKIAVSSAVCSFVTSCNLCAFIMSDSEEQYLTLSNNQKMPIIGLGTWQAHQEELEKTIELALDVGYRHIDTAYMYQNEEAIGNALKRCIQSGKIRREELFIVSKLPPKGNRPEGVEKYLNKSLEALQLDYLDAYLIHAPIGLQDIGEDLWPKDPSGIIAIDIKTDLVAIWKAMEEQVDAGRVHGIGLSNFNSKQINRILKAARIKPVCLQVELHLLCQQKQLVDFCRKKKIAVCAYAPLGSPNFKSDPEVTPLKDPLVCRIALHHNKTPAQVLLRHIIQRGIAAVPKTVTASRIKENIEVFDFELSEEEMKQLNAMDKGTEGRKYDLAVFHGLTSHPEFPFKIPF